MWSLIVAASLAGCGCESSTGPANASEIAVQLAPQLKTGSLLYTQGDCLAVRIYTASRYTHVASVVVGPSGITIYDTTGGEGVRRMTLDDYLASQTPGTLQLLTPRWTLNSSQTAEYTTFLESQVGRPYNVAHFATGSSHSGMHCSEYAVSALSHVKMVTVKNPARVSPASLLEGMTDSGLYTSGAELTLKARSEPVPESRGTCAMIWHSTTSAFGSTSRKLKGWFLCR